MKNSIKKVILTICLVLFATLGICYAFSFRNMTLDFIHISDVHLTSRASTSYKALGSSKELFKDAITQINDIQGLDFVLFTGDLVDYANKENYSEFYSLLSKLQYPSLNAFGNHDFSEGMDKDEVLEFVRANNPNYTFSDTYYAFSPKTDYRIIVLDSIIKDNSTARGELSQEQLEFLDNELYENQDKIVVIAMHHPSVEPFVATEHSLVNAKEFNEILLKYKNPIVVLSGHYHAGKIRHYGNLVFVSTPSLVTYPMAFRHIKITNFKDRVCYKFDFITTTLEDVKEENRQGVISYATLAGLEKDRTLEFTYYKKHPKSAKYKRKKIQSSSKVSKISKRELKKLTPADNIQKTNKFNFNFKNIFKKSNNNKEIKENKDLEETNVTKKTKKVKENKNKSSKFKNIFKKNKTVKTEVSSDNN